MTKRHKNRRSQRKASKQPTQKRAFHAWGMWLLVLLALTTLPGIGFLAHRSLRETGQTLPSAVSRSQRPMAVPKNESGPGVAAASPDKPQAVEPAPVPELTLEEKVLALKDEEMQLAQQLIAEFPQSEKPLVLMGDVLRRRGETAESVRFWEKALARNPQRADVYQRMAILAFDTDEFERTVTLCQQGLAIDPNRPGMHNLVARSLTRLGRYEEAIAAAQAELEISPPTALSYFLLGRAHWQRRDYEQAERAYLQVIDLQPDYTRAYYGLFNVYTRLKQPEEARRYLADFKKLDQQDRDRADKRRIQSTDDLNFCSLSLASLCDSAHELYGKTGNRQRTEGLLKRAVALQPANVKYLERLAFYYGVTKRIPQALALCQRIVEIAPNNATAHLNIGKFSLWQKRFGPAEAAFQKAIECNPDHSGGYQELARLYLRAGKKLDRAQVLAAKAVTLHPSADNYFLLGWACDVTGKPQAAVAALEQAVQLDPSQTKYRQAYERIMQREASK